MRPPLSLILALSAALPASALRPGIPRVTGYTDHFALTIDSAKSDLLPAFGALAESCWARQSRFFDFKPPGRIQMVFLDEQDYANGFAYAPQEWVVIHLHAAEFALRGRTRWLPNVMAHEIGHVFTLRKMGEDSRFLGWNLFHEWLGRGPSRFREGFQWEYGRVPPWLAEGLAQYAAAACGYDTLDNRRRMALRVAAASGKLLTPAQLKGFAWDARRNEMIYAQGFAWVAWLYSTYGPRAMNRYMDAARDGGWRSAFGKTFGKGLAELYRQWRKSLEAESQYEASRDGAYQTPDPSGPYAVESFPAPLGDGRFLYLSSRDNDNGETDLYLGDGKGGSRKLFRDVTSLRWDPAGRKAYFTATRFAFPQADVISDLYAYDAATGDIGRLTTGGRIVRGCATEGKVYAMRHDQGRTRIVRVENGMMTKVLAAPDSFEFTDLAPGRAAGSLTVGTSSGFGNDLRELDLASLELSPLAVSPQDEVDPHWSGDTLYFSADYGGRYDVYALAGDAHIRLTQVDGGAFHPFPSPDGLWISAYGPAGFRLARLDLGPKGGTLGKAAGPAQAEPFTVQLPISAWALPAPGEFEADAYDHTRMSLLGFDLSLGVESQPGYRETFRDSAGPVLATADAGHRTLAVAGLYWANPSGMMDAQAHLGLSRPIDYEGPVHLDRSDVGLRVRALLPDIVAEAEYAAFDLPEYGPAGRKGTVWMAALSGRLGAELRLSEHWELSGYGLAAEDFVYFGGESRNSDLRFGGMGSLACFNVQPGKDGIVKGFAAFAQGGKPPRAGRRVPDWRTDAGASIYGSLARLLFAEGSLYHTAEFADSIDTWVYGSARAHLSVPIGLQIGTRGGAGLYLDRMYPTVEFREMARFSESGGSGPGAWRAGRADLAAGGLTGPLPAAAQDGPRAWSPKLAGFGALVDREIFHEFGAGISLSTLAFSGRPARWSAMLRFDAEDFGREPSWSVSISL